jgi:hypothetical protein
MAHSHDSGDLRSEPNARPRDPFTVNRKQAAEAMRVGWGESYAISVTRTGFEAVRRHGRRTTLTAGLPDELVREMREDSAGNAQ